MTFPFRRPLEGIGCVEIPVAGITTNVYVLGDAGAHVLVDAGAADTAPEVAATLEANGVAPGSVRGIAVTHGHCDHYGGAAALAAWSGAPVWAHPAAAANLEDPWSDFVSRMAWMPNAGARAWDEFRALAGGPVRVARALRDLDALEAGAMRLEVLHVPGHERGAVALFERARRLAFVGDLVQGGMDASANWLGLYSDVESQRRSLARVAELSPAWLFKGHREPRSGADVARDLASARERVEKIERAVLGAVGAAGTVSLAEVVREAVRAVLGREDLGVPRYAAVTVRAVLAHLARRGRVRQTADLAWRRTRS